MPSDGARRTRAPPPRLCAEPEPPAEEMDDAPAEAGEAPREVETQVEAVKRIFVGTEFGAQVAGLTVAFAAFLAWSSTALDSEFWMTPF